MKRYGLGEEGEMERIKLANVLMLLSRGDGGEERSSTGRVFECKTCNRQFSSFQALGGHRASHKKPRLMGDDQSQAQGRTERRVHQCSICGLQFAIGQALGGHMRRHRATTEGYGHGLVAKNSDGKKVLCLDLNLTPSENNVECGTRIFGIELVSRTPMVDCFH